MSLSIGGTASTLEPLLLAGMDVGYDATQHFNRAAREGNVETSNILLDHGAEIYLGLVTDFIGNLGRVMQHIDQAEGLILLLQRMFNAIGPLQDLDAGCPMFDKLIYSFIAATRLSEPWRYLEVDRDCGSICMRVIEVFLQNSLVHEGRLRRRMDQVEVQKNGGWGGSGLILAIEICRLLLRYGYDVEETDPFGCDTPIMYAVKFGLVEQVAALLPEGADISKVSRCGRAVWEIAALCTVQRHVRPEDPRTERYMPQWTTPYCVDEDSDRKILAMILDKLTTMHNLDPGACDDSKTFPRICILRLMCISFYAIRFKAI